MDKIKNIIAAVGIFPHDNPVLARAAEVARSHGAKLTIVHVIDSLTGFDFVSTDLRSIQHQMRLDALESVEAAASQVVGVTSVDIRVETGSPPQRLLELIDELCADLIIMRAHQRSSILEKIIGSTTDQVIRTSRVPVLVVKRPVKRAYHHVAVSIDTEDSSCAVIPFIDMLFPAARLFLLHFVYIPQQFEVAMLRAGAGQSITPHRDAMIRQAKASLRAMAQKLEHRTIKSTHRVVVGDPAISLVRATRSSRADLIVLGPSTTGVMRRALIGSVTNRVLASAACDVLICRTTAQDAHP